MTAPASAPATAPSSGRRFDLAGLFLIAWALRLAAALYAGGVLKMLVTDAPGSLLGAIVRVLMILAAAEALWVLRDIGLRTRQDQPPGDAAE